MNRDIQQFAGVLIVAAIMAAVLMVLMSLAGCAAEQKREFVQAVPGVPVVKLKKGEAFIAPADGEFYTTAYLNSIKAAMKKRAEEASE